MGRGNFPRSSPMIVKDTLCCVVLSRSSGKKEERREIRGPLGLAGEDRKDGSGLGLAGILVVVAGTCSREWSWARET